MTSGQIIAEQKDTIAGLRDKIEKQAAALLMATVVAAVFITLTLFVAIMAAETQDKLNLAEATIAILKK